MAGVDSPEWWLRSIHRRLLDRRPNVELCREYYDGQHRLAFASRKFAETFGGLFGAFADNWCGLVVDASVERLQVQGFRVGENPEGDADAARIWQRNNADSESQLAFTESHVAGEAVATCWVGDDGLAEITWEPADTALVVSDPKNRQRRLAGARFYLDEWGYEHAELFRPDAAYMWRSKTPRRGNTLTDSARVHWVADDSIAGSRFDGELAVMDNPFGVVPMVPLTNNPRLWRSPEECAIGSEIQQIIPLQDAVNKLIADLLVASEAGAAPLRYATGYTPEIDPKSNEVKAPPWTRDGATWAVIQDATGKFGSLPAADLGNFVKAIDTLVQHIASISRTPPHYLNSSADRLSGESIKSAETGLVAKVRGKQRSYDDSLEELIRLAGVVDGIDHLANATQCETIWADPESRTESEHIDALSKKKELGVPLQQLWEEAPYSPEQIARFPAMQAQATLNDLIRLPDAD